MDGAFESQTSALVSLSRLLYDEVVKSLLRIVEKLDLSVEKITPTEEVRSQVSLYRTTAGLGTEIVLVIIGSSCIARLYQPLTQEYTLEIGFSLL